MEAKRAHPDDVDGHRYSTISAHTTSEGRIAYQRCACGMWRIERFPRFGDPITQASIGRRQRQVEPVVDAPVEAAVGGHLAMSDHVVCR